MPAPKGHKPYPGGGETGGRPVKYTPEFIEKEAGAFLEWMSRKDSLWYEDFALQRGYDPDLFSIWAKENERFSGVYKKAKAWQKSLLVRGGLLNKLNSNIVKLVLFNTSGWSDRQETKLSGDAANPLAFVLNAIDGSTKDLTCDEAK